MTITAIIPSRYGSSRFDGKPLAKIAGKPMIRHVYERVKAAASVSQVVVATDDQRILEAVADFGGEAILTGPDNRSGTDRVGDAADRLGLSMSDIVVNVQGDQPLIDARCIDQLTAPFLSDAGVVMSTLAYAIVDQRELTDPKDVKVVFGENGRALYFSRAAIPCARDAGTVHDTYKHLGVYAYRRSFLEVFRNLPEGRLEQIEKLEQLRVLEFGYPIQVVVTPYDSPEVDLPEDIARIEARL